MAKSLSCPGCYCQLQAPETAVAGMTCPRCMTWVAFQSACTGGSCFSCSESSAVNAGGCGSSSGSAPQTDQSGNLVAIGWKWLIKRLFPVR